MNAATLPRVETAVIRLWYGDPHPLDTTAIATLTGLSEPEVLRIIHAEQDRRYDARKAAERTSA